LPAKLFSFQTPYSSAVRCSVSASSEKGSPYFSLKLTWELSSSGLTPSTTAPARSNSLHASRIPHACAAQPGVSSLG
jgi:hypothetical protein